MALAKMTKARVAVHKSVADELVAKLQALGCCEFARQKEDVLSGGAMASLLSNQKRIDELLGDAKYLLRVLEPLEEKKESSFSKMLGEAPKMGLGELASKVDQNKFASIVASVRDKERTLTEIKADLSRVKGLLSQSDTLISIKYPLELFTAGTDTVTGMIYTFPKNSASSLSKALTDSLGELYEIQELPSDENDPNVTFAILSGRKGSQQVMDICAELAGSRVDVPKDFGLTAAKERENLLSEIEKLEKAEEDSCAALASMTDEGLDIARHGGDYWAILKDRLDSMLSCLATDDVMIWSFWMPEEKSKIVQNAIGEFESLVQFDLVEPDEDETPPTLLKNPSWSSSIEPLTLMYGTPTYGRVDPTSLMAPFFFVFLGMCFGDAGYGLVLSGVLGYFLVRYSLPPTLRKFFIMLTIGMVFTMIMGALTGSWFGDSIEAFPFLNFLIPLKDSLMFLDPMNDPMTLLIISLGLGFVQVIFGLLIAFKENWSQGERLAAFSDQGGWIVFLVGLLMFGLASSGKITGPLGEASKYIAILGAVILIATQGREKKGIVGKLFSGVLSLYNVTGYLGDVLSYSRLLALGLGSAAVGMVINLLASLVAGLPYIGIPAAILIFVLGHLFSIAVNLLGAFIHSLRLQYVEFFGKFYDANGKDFTPLRNMTQFINLSEESAGH